MLSIERGGSVLLLGMHFFWLESHALFRELFFRLFVYSSHYFRASSVIVWFAEESKGCSMTERKVKLMTLIEPFAAWFVVVDNEI